jgi:hypothetical protein
LYFQPVATATLSVQNVLVRSWVESCRQARREHGDHGIPCSRNAEHVTGFRIDAPAPAGFDKCNPRRPQRRGRDSPLVARYSDERYNESFNNVAPAVSYFGQQHPVLGERSKIKQQTMERRNKEYLDGKTA